MFCSFVFKHKTLSTRLFSVFLADFSKRCVYLLVNYVSCGIYAG